MKKKKEPEPVQFKNCVAHAVPGYTICNLSEADIKELNAGRVPDWLVRTTDFYLRPDPKPSDVPPEYLTYEQEAAKLKETA